MKDIYNVTRLLFWSAIGYLVLQAIPQLLQAATLPAQIDAQNARIQAEAGLVREEAKAAPTFVALRVEATRQAIANEAALARAHANAQVVEAEGNAAKDRAVGTSLLVGAVGIVVLAFGLFAINTARLVLVRQSVKLGGAVASLPSGGMGYLPAPSGARDLATTGGLDERQG